MELTLSVIKADIGGYVGHSSCHPDVVQKAREKLEHAKRHGLLVDYRVTVCGDEDQDQAPNPDRRWPGIHSWKAPI